jgi:hypothetical protein
MKKRNLQHLGEYASRVVMIFVGAACLVLSIFYSKQFYETEFHKGPAIAALLAATIALFNAFSLTAANFLIKHRQKIMAAILIPIAICTMAFDVSTIVGAQSAIYISNDQANTEIAAVTDAADQIGITLKSAVDQATSQLTFDRDAYRLAQTNLATATNAYNAAFADETTKRNVMDSTPIPDGVDRNSHQPYVIATNAWSTARTRTSQARTAMADAKSALDEAQRIMEASQAALTKANEAYAEHLNTKIEVPTNELAATDITLTFANWLGSVITFIPRKWIEFVLVLIPAIFIDLISPIAINFAMTLRKEEEDERDPLEDDDVKAKLDEKDEEIRRLGERVEEEVARNASKDQAGGEAAQKYVSEVEAHEATKKSMGEVVEHLNEITEERDKLIGELAEANEKMEKLAAKPKTPRKVGARKRATTPAKLTPVEVHPGEPIEFKHNFVELAKMAEEVKKNLPDVEAELNKAATKELKEVIKPNNYEPPKAEDVKEFPITEPPRDEVEYVRPTPIHDVPFMIAPQESPFDPNPRALSDAVEATKKEFDQNSIREEIKSDDDGEMHGYRFGKTTRKVADKFAEFTRACVGKAGKFELEPEKVASVLKINSTTLRIFLDRLSRLTLNSRPLIQKQANGYFANFSADEIVNYATERTS